MAGTEFDPNQTGGDSVSRETVAARNGSRTAALGAIDGRLNGSESNEPERDETTGSTWNEERPEAVAEPANGPRELLSESTDLNALMAAILGEDAGERLPLEDVAGSRSAYRVFHDADVAQELDRHGFRIEHLDPAPDTADPWRLELETLLSAEPPREIATVIRTHAPATAALVSSGRFSKLKRLRAAIPRWPTGRVSLVTLSALAVVTWGMSAWHVKTSDPAQLSMQSSDVTTTAEASSRTIPGPGTPRRSISTDAVNGSLAPAGSSGEPGSTVLQRGLSATSSNETLVRRSETPSPAEPRQLTTPRSIRATTPREASRPLDSASSPEAAPAREPPVATTEIGKPPQLAPNVTSIAESSAASISNTASPATVTAGGGTTDSARPEPPAVAPAVPMQRTEPRLMRRAVPEYPSHLRRAKVGGTVTVTMTVDAEGRVVNVRSISGPTGLRPAAEAAAQRWRYEPATLNGKPLESSVNVTFTFDPSDPQRLY